MQGIAEQSEQEARRRLDKCLMWLRGRASHAATPPTENHSSKARPADRSGGRLFREEEAHRPWARFPCERNLTSHAGRTDLVIHIRQGKFLRALARLADQFLLLSADQRRLWRFKFTRHQERRSLRRDELLAERIWYN